MADESVVVGIDEKRPISQKKLEANRRNALRSTGPRTPAGKRAVRANALKHGAFAKELILRSAYLGEDPEEFERLLDELEQDLQPQGALERMLLEQIAISHTNQLRAYRCQLAETEQRMFYQRVTLARKRAKPIHVPEQEQRGRGWRKVLEEARKEIETKGYLVEALELELRELVPSDVQEWIRG